MPATRTILTVDQVTSIVALYREGKAISAIAREYDIPASSVRLQLKRQGVLNVNPNSNAGRKRTRQHLTQDLITQAIDMVNEGKTLTQISGILNANPVELSQTLTSQGLVFRRGRRKAQI